MDVPPLAEEVHSGAVDIRDDDQTFFLTTNTNYMKNNITVPIFFIVIGVIMYLNYTRVNRLKRQLAIETAKTNFVIAHCNNQTATYDSVYAKNDTISFYDKGVLLSRTVTE